MEAEKWNYYLNSAFFTWLDSYDIYDEMGNTVYTVKGELSWGHKLQIYNADGLPVGTIKEEVFTFFT